MIFSWAAIGTIVGLLLGLTGAGGAVIAVPLFVYIVGATIRDATALSLIAVLTGSLLNWILQARWTNYRLSFILVVFSALGSFAFTPLKSQAPEWVITALFLAVSLWSLFALWKPKGETPDTGPSPAENSFIKGSAGGFALGGLVTMTGLGGGVMLMPMLKGVFGMPLNQAAATSLLTILASSAFSIWMQRESLATLTSPTALVAMGAGTIIAAFVSKRIAESLQQAKLDRLRLVLISAVILISTASLILKTLNSQ